VNGEVLDTLLAKRHELATLLGFDCWASYALQASAGEPVIKKIDWEAVGVDRKLGLHRAVHHFPVPRGGVLARGDFCHAAKGRARTIHLRDGPHPGNVAKPSRNQVRDLETAGGFNDVVQRVSARISKALRIGERPNPKGIEHDDEDPALRSSTDTHP
jgi:hypothetical protein